MPNRALSLNSATTKRPPGHHYLPETPLKQPKADAGAAQLGPGTVGPPSAPGGVWGDTGGRSRGSGVPGPRSLPVPEPEPPRRAPQPHLRQTELPGTSPRREGL